MYRTIVAIALTLTCLTATPAAAGSGSGGEVVFSDALYGAGIGTLVGGAAWLIDQTDASTKIGTGILIGTVAGVVFGVAEAESLVRIEDGRMRFALPSPAIRQHGDDRTYTVGLLSMPLP